MIFIHRIAPFFRRNAPLLCCWCADEILHFTSWLLVTLWSSLHQWYVIALAIFEQSWWYQMKQNGEQWTSVEPSFHLTARSQKQTQIKTLFPRWIHHGTLKKKNEHKTSVMGASIFVLQNPLHLLLGGCILRVQKRVILTQHPNRARINTKKAKREETYLVYSFVATVNRTGMMAMFCLQTFPAVGSGAMVDWSTDVIKFDAKHSHSQYIGILQRPVLCSPPRAIMLSLSSSRFDANDANTLNEQWSWNEECKMKWNQMRFASSFFFFAPPSATRIKVKMMKIL